MQSTTEDSEVELQSTRLTVVSHTDAEVLGKRLPKLVVVPDMMIDPWIIGSS